MSSSSFRTVTIAGATGVLGYPIAEAFLNDGSYKVKVLRRKPESDNANANVLASKGAEIVYADYSQKSELVEVLKGTDVLVSSTSGEDHYSAQAPLLAAAKEANVKRFIPSEFGTEIKHPYQDGKFKLREEIEKSGLEYTYMYTGLFSEFLGWIGFDIKNKKVTFYADRNSKIAITSLADIGKYTVESLKVPEARNGHIRVASEVVTLNELLQKFEEATDSKWEVAEDKEVRHRYRNKIEPVPELMEDFRTLFLENGCPEKNDNSKFSFTPSPVIETIKVLVKQA